MKKNLSTAMAAAMAFGAVVPAFAAEVETRAVTAGTQTLDARLAAGYESAIRVLSRQELYNTNGTTDRKDDTLKATYKDAKILAEKLDAKSPYADKFAVAIKSTNVSAINDENADIKTVESIIADAKRAGATITKVETAASFDGTTFTEGKIVVTVTPKVGDTTTVAAVYTFNGVDGIKGDETVSVADLKKIFSTLNLNNTYTAGVGTAADTLSIDLDTNKTNNANYKVDYEDLNLVKYAIESNIAKFDVVKEEVAGGTPEVANRDLQVKLLKKGTKEEVLVLTLNNFAKVDKDLVINMPAKNDFAGHWANETIESAMIKGWVDASSTYRPDDSVTRAEFAKILCNIFEIDVNGTEPFSDVKSADWYYDYVVSLYNTKTTETKVEDQEGIIQGNGDEKFNPNAPITREEAAIMLAKVHSTKVQDTKVVTGGTVEKPIYTHTDFVTKFKDDKLINVWADQSVNYLNTTKNGRNEVIVEGFNGNFNPQHNITRAETLVMIERASNK